MAKGNLFQGMARGKVGDVVFYRMNGVQMSRVRNRAPKNPRSNEQLYQRAVIASVMKAYSAGKEIFDHSFQGYTVGEGCMRRFNSVNARIARNLLVNDISNATAASKCMGRYVNPGSLYPAAIPSIQVSEGTLVNNLFLLEPIDNQEDDTIQRYHIKVADNPEESITTLGQYLDALGINAGDIFTFVFFRVDKNTISYQPNWTASNYAKAYKTTFGWMRLIVRDDINNNATLTGANFHQMFNFEFGGEGVSDPGYAAFNPGMVMPFPVNDIATIACVRSRNDYDLRSTEYMVPASVREYGIASYYLLEVWQNMVEKIGESELILEGGDGPSLQPVSLNQDTPIIDAPVSEYAVPRMARHKGTRNNPE